MWLALDGDGRDGVDAAAAAMANAVIGGIIGLSKQMRR